MSRLTRSAITFVALAAAACNWTTFDDLANSAWLAETTRDDVHIQGDFVLAATSMNVASGAMFELSSWSSPAGMAQATYDKAGARTDLIGFVGQSSGGPLSPLSDQMSAQSLAYYSTGKFVAGIPDLFPSAGGIVRYDVGLQSGQVVFDGSAGGQTDMGALGSALAVGDLGLGSTTPDIVAVGLTTVVVIPGTGGGVTRACALKRPPQPGSPVVAMSNVAAAPVLANGHAQIVVSGFDGANNGHIYVLEATSMPAVTLTPRAVCGSGGAPAAIDVATGTNAPIALAVGNLDSDSHLEIVAGNPGLWQPNQSGLWQGKVDIYMNVQIAGTPTKVSITPPANAGSQSFGDLVRVANVDGSDAALEIVVADPGAMPEGVQNAGQVSIYKFGNLAQPLAALWIPSPAAQDRFGRALATAHYPTPTSTTEILGVAAKDKFWVYFKVVAAAPDPRQP